jgi:CBS-domain-containing membrane protein
VRKTVVKELMVPLSEYATVNIGATLYAAVMELDKSQEEFWRSRYLHRAILVLDENSEILGKISQVDVLRALEPKYRAIVDAGKISHSGFSPQFLKTMMNAFDLWEQPLADICKNAAAIRVKDFIYSPGKGEFVRENATLGEAIHQLVMGSHHSLIVMNDEDKIVGILRLTDVFERIFQTIKKCEM